MEYRMKVLITGADGFIGSHLTEALVNNGFNVRAFVCYNSFNSYGWLDSISNEIKDKIEFFPGDIRDPNGVNEAIKGIDIVFHLAALIAIPFSYHSPDSYIDTNVKGTLNVIQAAKNNKVKRNDWYWILGKTSFHFEEIPLYFYQFFTIFFS